MFCKGDLLWGAPLGLPSIFSNNFWTETAFQAYTSLIRNHIVAMSE